MNRRFLKLAIITSKCGTSSRRATEPPSLLASLFCFLKRQKRGLPLTIDDWNLSYGSKLECASKSQSIVNGVPRSRPFELNISFLV